MEANSIVLSCNTGIISEIVDYGIASSKEDPSYCLRNTTGQCNNSLSSGIKTQLQACIGNATCKITNLKSQVISN
jgi:hypothetical protein